MSALRELEQLAELNLSRDLGPTGSSGTGSRGRPAGLPGVYLAPPRPARQLLYVTRGLTRQTAEQQISSVHELVTNRPVKA
jgi:hypothetical protein